MLAGKMSSKHVACLEMWRMLNLRCQCDTEMWSLGLALQHMKANIQIVTFERLFMVSDHLKKLCFLQNFMC